MLPLLASQLHLLIGVASLFFALLHSFPVAYIVYMTRTLYSYWLSISFSLSPKKYLSKPWYVWVIRRTIFLIIDSSLDAPYFCLPCLVLSTCYLCLMNIISRKNELKDDYASICVFCEPLHDFCHL